MNNRGARDIGKTLVETKVTVSLEASPRFVNKKVGLDSGKIDSTDATLGNDANGRETFEFDRLVLEEKNEAQNIVDQQIFIRFFVEFVDLLKNK